MGTKTHVSANKDTESSPEGNNNPGASSDGNAPPSKVTKKETKEAAKQQQEEDKLKPRNEPKKKPRTRRPGDILLHRQNTIDVITKFQMGQPELKKLKNAFLSIDIDGSGEIDYEEFFEFIDETRTPFADGLFKMIDADNSGAVDFEEFVHAVTIYCMYTREEILRFAYDTFDTDGSGTIDEYEFRKLCSVVNDGKPVFPGNFKKALNEFDRNGDGLIDFDEFQNLNKRYPLILFPCFRLQDRMQKSTLGEKHWHILAKRYYQQLKKMNYRRKHNGADPPMPLGTKIKRMFGVGVYEIYQP